MKRKYQGSFNSLETHTIPTGIQVMISQGYYGHICARSGVEQHGLLVGGGVIDSDFRKEIQIIATNVGNNPYHVCFSTLLT